MAKWTTSKLKRKLMMMIAEEPDVFNLIDDKTAEYPDDLIWSRIFPTVKFDSTINEALTFIGIKIDYPNICKNELYKNFTFTIMIISHNNILKTRLGECRTDAIAEKLIDLFNWNNQFDFTFELIFDCEDPLNDKFYCRKLIFKSITSNSMNNGVKRYD